MPAVLVALSSLAGQPARAQTFCTVTINSANERHALRAAFPHAQFVELTDFGSSGPNDSADWFSGACRAGIQCDVVLISGHFAAKFFGDTPFELSIRTLEQQSCQATCDGVLKQPKLVFLFGCNTLADKQPDRRSPGQYRSILVRDGLDPDLAARVVATRYGPLGDSTRTRIQKVFSPEALILGFSSVGPVGDVAGPRFRRFLLGAGTPLERFLHGGRSAERDRTRLERGWVTAFRGLNPTHVEGGPAPTANECRFSDLRTSRLEKLLSAERLLRDGSVQNALRVYDFLQGESDWSDQETRVLTRMKDDLAARHDILAVLPHLSDTPAVYFSMLQFARLLDWIDEAELLDRRNRQLRSLLLDGVTVEEADFLCSRDFTYLPPKEVLARNLGSRNFIRALPCLSAGGASVRDLLLRHLSMTSRSVRLAALDALTELRLLEDGDAAQLRRMYGTARSDEKQSLLWALAASDGTSLEIQRFIAAAAMDPEEEVAWTSAQVLKHLRAGDAETLRLLARALSRTDGFVRRGVALVFESLLPQNARVLEQLQPFLADADPVVRQAMTRVFTSPPVASRLR